MGDGGIMLKLCSPCWNVTLPNIDKLTESYTQNNALCHGFSLFLFLFLNIFIYQVP